MNILEVAFNEEALTELTKLVERFEKVCSILSVSAPGAKAALKKVVAQEESDKANGHDEDDGEDFAPKKVKTVSKSFLDEDDEEAADEEMKASGDDEEDAEEAPKKEKKKKKLTVDLINDACKERAQRLGGKEGRAEVLGILKKKFKVSSVTELKPDSYAAVISAMRAE